MIETLSGMVRPVLAFAFAGAIIVGFFLAKINTDQFMGIAGLIVGFYFGVRSGQTGPERVNVERATINARPGEGQPLVIQNTGATGTGADVRDTDEGNRGPNARD